MINCYVWDVDSEVTRTRDGHSPTGLPGGSPASPSPGQASPCSGGLETNPVRGFAQGLGELVPCSSQEKSLG